MRGALLVFALAAECSGRMATCEPVDEIPYDGVDQDCDGEDLTDRDGDGWDAERVGGRDCHDGDASIHPGVDEHCDDEDENCNGEVDEEPVDGHTWYADRDHDGWGNDDEPFLACEKGAVWWVERAGDCDDLDDEDHPGADERCDGEDDDCDGVVDEDPIDGVYLHPDEDGDGWGTSDIRTGCPGTPGLTDAVGDCDDADPAVHPEAVEICDDGVDQDCDGTPSGCAPWGAWDAGDDAEVVVIGPSTAGLGHDVAVADGDGDGLGDLLLGDAFAGQVYLLTSPLAATLDAEDDADLVVEDAGFVLAAADLDGDGGDEVVLGDPWADAIYAFDSGATGQVTRADAAVLVDEEVASFFGWAVAGVGDIDGDGYEDLLVGAPGSDYYAVRAGAAYLVLGPHGDWSGTLDPEATLAVEEGESEVGTGLGVAPDLDGDGAPDLLVGSESLDTVYVVPTPVSGAWDLSTFPRIEGRGGFGAQGTFAAADVDGDGTSDLLGGHPKSRGGSSYPQGGRATLHYGPIGSRWYWTRADAELVGEYYQGGMGDQVLLPGDIDGNAGSEVLVYEPGRSSVYALRGTLSGSLLREDAEGVVHSMYRAPAPLAAADLDGDGRADLVLGYGDEVTVLFGHGI